MIAIELPWPPSANRYWRYVDGRVLIAAKGRAYRRAVAQAVMLFKVGGKLPEPLDGRLAVAIGMNAPDQRARDVDNILKATLDACTHAGLWHDDSQIDDLRVVRGPVRQNDGRLVLRVAPCEPA